MITSGNNIKGFNSFTLDRAVTIAKEAIAHASNLNEDLGSDILYVPTTGPMLNDHAANVKAIIENRLKNKFSKIVGA